MISSYRFKLERRKGAKNQILKNISSCKDRIKILKRNQKDIDRAQIIIQTVAQKTQQELEFHISDIVTLALESIFDEPYQFKVIFEIKRGKTEAKLLFLKDGSEVDPMTASGGGTVDVAAFALRVALWTLKTGRNTIVLDEPFRFLSSDLQPKAGKMLSLLSKKLKLQFIIVTHNKHLIETADKLISVSIKNKITRVE